MMSARDEVYKSALELAAKKPYDQITLAEVAELAGVHWTTVSRCFGGKSKMRNWLRDNQKNEELQNSDTRSRIIEAAGAVFSSMGYNQASLDLVADYAGMTKGAVYWHFSSKQELFLALLELRLQQQIRYVSMNTASMLASDNPPEALRKWLQGQLGGLAETGRNPGLFMEFVIASREPEVQARLVGLQRQFLQAIAELIAELQRRGQLSSRIHASNAALLIDSIMKGTAVEWMIDPERVDLEAYLESVSLFIWGFLGLDE
jgi:AcrR family transcriptional regulator